MQMQQRHKWRIWAALILIVILSWIENQNFTETSVPADKVKLYQLLHMAFLAGIAVVGYWGWYKHPARWVKKIWIIAYAFAMVVVTGIGLINSKMHWFNDTFMDQIHNFRVFFCSPVPFLALLVLASMKGFAGNPSAKS